MGSDGSRCSVGVYCGWGGDSGDGSDGDYVNRVGCVHSERVVRVTVKVTVVTRDSIVVRRWN